MIIDAQQLPDDHLVETDVCIIGAGPVGLTLAKEFQNQSFQVCLLESGGLQSPDETTTALNPVETKGDFLPNTSSSVRWYAFNHRADLTQVNPVAHHRQLGGNSHTWNINLPSGQIGVRHVPLATADFEVRSHIPYSGWPFDRNALEPYYRRAHAALQMSKFSYDVDDWATPESPKLPFQEDPSGGSVRILTRMYQFSPSAVFHRDGRQILESASNITTYIHATVMALETDALGKTVQRVKVSSLAGKYFWVEAKIVVLATGGIENARLLLLSDQVHPAGLGNEQDLVGRFFMDHPLIYGGRLQPHSPDLFNKMSLYDMRQVNGSNVMGHLTISHDMLHQAGLLNFSAYLFPRFNAMRSRPGMRALKAILIFAMLRQSPVRLLHYFWQIIRHFNDILMAVAEWIYSIFSRNQPYYTFFSDGGWSYLQPHPDKAYRVFEVIMQVEQLPHPDNRVVLSTNRDPLGRRKPALQTRWRSQELEAIQTGQAILAAEFAKTGLATFQPEWDGDRPSCIYNSACHHMGTTRMSTSPTSGVVDQHCRVHSVSNLYIAGSSVFPTGGYANPTLTAMALAIRLSDRIKQVL